MMAINLFTNSLSAQTSNNNVTGTSNPSKIQSATLSIATDRIKYVEGQSIIIFGTVYDQAGNPFRLPISVKVKELYDNQSALLGRDVFGAVLKPNDNGTFSANINKGLREGNYVMVGYISFASAQALGISSVNATTTFSVENIFTTTPLVILYLGSSIGIGGIILIQIQRSRSFARLSRPENIKNETLSPSSFETLQFIFLTVLAFTPVVSFALTDVEIFPNSPIGIIVKPTTVVSSGNTTQLVGEWMINIGGNGLDKYKSGIQVPVAIFIFGIAGGYLRYLFSQAEKLTEIRKNRKTRQDNVIEDPYEVGYEILRDVALFFLSPLLAIAVWLALWQGGTTSPFTLAAVSFVTGLVTKEAQEALVKFGQNILNAITGSRTPDVVVVSPTGETAPSIGGGQGEQERASAPSIGGGQGEQERAYRKS
jgi:hypothetical protein